MGVDDLAVRRGRAAKKAGPPPRPPRAVPFWRWMATQHHHTNPAVRAAVAHIRDRWGFTERYSHATVLSTLSKEDSVHLVAARQLADEYALIFGVNEDTRRMVSGVGGQWFPFGPEICSLCTREAIPGTGHCARHGGQWVTEEDRAAASRVIAERMEMLSARAVRVIEDLLDHGRSERVRLDAAVVVLDRSGFGPSATLRLEGDGGPDPADLVRDRLEQLGASIRVAVDADGYIDGEVLDEADVADSG